MGNNKNKTMKKAFLLLSFVAAFTTIEAQIFTLNVEEINVADTAFNHHPVQLIAKVDHLTSDFDTVFKC